MTGIRDRALEMGLDTAMGYLEKDPEENMPKLMAMAKKLMAGEEYRSKIEQFDRVVSDRDDNMHRLLVSLFTDIDTDVRKTVARNFIINSFYRWSRSREENSRKYGCSIPWTILIDPTSACNLRCTGCWAAEYGSRLNLDEGLLDSIITQAEDLGMHFFLFSGGEPLVRKDLIIRLCGKHPESVFSCFTNGTLIDGAFAEEMLRVRNLVPAISVEGFGNATDSRRGEGTYGKVVEAARILKEHRLPFGFSLCYTSENSSVIGSEEFFDWMIDAGAKFSWFFTYMPVGKGAPTSLMVSAEQREWMYRRIRAYRKTKPIWTMDFWNDGEYVKGCVAGGRYYLHINANGDAEPCAFIHYSNCNIKEHTLIEILQSPLFRQYRQGQPFSSNYLRPCPLLDNPGKLPRMVDASHAHSTDLASPEDVHELASRCEATAEAWKETADRLWAEKPRIG